MERRACRVRVATVPVVTQYVLPTYSHCVSVVLVIRHAKHMRRVLLSLWPVWFYNIFPHYHLINGMIFGGKKITGPQTCFHFLYKSV